MHHSHETRPESATAPGRSLWKTILGFDLASSVVVFFVALPLCMGIAQASGAPIASGIITGIVGGLIVGFISGSPLQVSGPAAGLTVLVYGLIQEHGLQALGIVVLLAGLIQLAAGLLKLGQWFRAVSPAVIRGMLTGIGILIFASQFHVMVDDETKGSPVKNLISIPGAIMKGIGPVELIPAEARDVRAEYIHRFGRLQEQQEQIAELVAERVSANPSEAEIALEKSLLEPVVGRQAELFQQLKTTAAEARATSLTEENSSSAAQFTSALDEALTANAAALAALDTRDLDVVGERLQQATAELAGVTSSLKNHTWAALLGLLTIGTIVLWQTAAPKRWRLVPGPLIALVLTAGTAFALSLPVLYIVVPDSIIEGIRLPSMTALQNIPILSLIGSALVFAAIASAETLLCASAIDQMHTGPRARFDRELAAQGVGNMICGFLGALPMTGVIVRSSTNVHAGAKTRFSAILHGAWLLLFVVVLGGFLQYIPTAVLAGILVYVGWRLIDFKALKDLRAFGWSEVGIFLATVIGIVAINLLVGVVLGIVLASLKLLLTFSKLKCHVKRDADENSATLELVGAATFVGLPKLARALEGIPAGSTLHLDLSHLTYLDDACGQLMATWTRQHRTSGGDIIVDWNSLHGDLQRFFTPTEQLREEIANNRQMVA